MNPQSCCRLPHGLCRRLHAALACSSETRSSNFLLVLSTCFSPNFSVRTTLAVNEAAGTPGAFRCCHTLKIFGFTFKWRIKNTLSSRSQAGQKRLAVLVPYSTTRIEHNFELPSPSWLTSRNVSGVSSWLRRFLQGKGGGTTMGGGMPRLDRKLCRGRKTKPAERGRPGAARVDNEASDFFLVHCERFFSVFLSQLRRQKHVAQFDTSPNCLMLFETSRSQHKVFRS